MKNLLFVFIIIFLFSCAEKNHFKKPSIQSKFIYKIESSNKFYSYWWQSFKLSQLNKLIDYAINENLDLKIAVLRIKQAEIQYQKDKKVLLPEVTSNLIYTRTRQKEKHRFKTTINQYQLGLYTNYEIDVWKKLRSSIDISKIEINKQKYYYDSLLITIASEITKNFFTIAKLSLEKKLIEKKLKIIAEKLKILEIKYKNNVYSIVDYISASQEKINLMNYLNEIEANVKIYKNQIKILLGKSTDYNLKIKNYKLPEIYSPLDIGIPSKLLENRPDIKISLLNVYQSFKNINIAFANRLPVFTFSSQLIYSSDYKNKILNIFDNWFYSFITKIAYPLIDYKKRKLQQKIAELQSNEAIIHYKNTILNAIKEVEDSFVNLDKDKKNIENLKSIIKAQSEKCEKLKYDYLFGKIDIIPYLNSQLLIIDYKTQLLNLQLRYLSDLVNLYKSAGGIYFNVRI